MGRVSGSFGTMNCIAFNPDGRRYGVTLSVDCSVASLREVKMVTFVFKFLMMITTNMYEVDECP